MNKAVSWEEIKNQAVLRKVSLQWVEKPEKYTITLVHKAFVIFCVILKLNPPSQEQLDFEGNYKDNGNNFSPDEIVGQMEKNDKTLKCFGAYAVTNEEGVAEIAVPIPIGVGKEDGRWFAYGDAEWEHRHFKDRVSYIGVEDLDRRIAWMVALSMDENAQAPIPDEVIQAMGDQIPGGPFPFYPILDTYSENRFPEQMPPNAKGEIFGGMTMTFAYGNTEVQPVGGYGYSPGGFYFVLKATKDPRVGVSVVGNNPTQENPMGSRAGYTIGVTVDWARGDNK